MSGAEVQVIPEDLARKATQIRSLSLSPAGAQPHLISPDALATSGVALTNLRVNAEAIRAYQEFGRLEGLRLAQTLDNVAAAYADVDRASGEAIGNTVGGPESFAVPHGTSYPERVDLPTPPHPPSMPIPKGQLTSEQLLFPPEAQRALESGDGGASLRAAAQTWRNNAQSLAASAQQFETNSLLWEGEAADAAYSKFNAYRDWLISLAGSWRRLAAEADRMVDAHSTARQDNEPIAQDFERLEQELAQHPASADNLRKTLQMAELQIQSEEIRNRYARDGQPRQIQPEDPPSPVLSGIPVTDDDHRRARRTRTDDERSHHETGAGTAGNGSSPPEGGQPDPSERQAVSPIPAAERPTPGAQQVGSPSGGSADTGQRGGAPGGGSPTGGQSGASIPVAPVPGPKTPADPSLRPAAAPGGGSGGRGAGGAPASSLQPVVGAETVAPAPGTAAVPPTTTASSSAGGAGAAGGLGGMAPMMHGARADGTGDKKRNPQLSEDEGLYTEDRPWTEAVIGNRVRRRCTANDTKKEPS